MINDLTLLQVMRKREAYEKYSKYIKRDVLTQEGITLLDDFGIYFSSFPSVDVITPADFSTWFSQVRHPQHSTTILKLYNLLIDKLEEEPGVLGEELVRHYEKLTIHRKIDSIIKSNGDLDEIKHLVENNKSYVDYLSYIQSMDIREISASITREEGLSWRLKELNQGFGKIGLGDFIVVAGRPETGKTTFLGSEVTRMGEQIHGDGCILWFNNEGAAHDATGRIYQAALDMTTEEINRDLKGAYNKYVELMGHVNKIRVIDAHGFTFKTIEKIVDDVRPQLIVIDMLDHVKGFIRNNVAETSDEKYDRQYQWARDLSVKYAPLIGTSQIPSLEGLGDPGNRYPPMDKLKGSTTAKQGAAKAILMIGHTETTGNARFLHAPKNKLTGKHFKYEVRIDPEKGRYVSVV